VQSGGWGEEERWLSHDIALALQVWTLGRRTPNVLSLSPGKVKTPTGVASGSGTAWLG
jgi:hypothetical protein